MEQADPSHTITPILRLREVDADGRCVGLITVPNGMWKMEVFASTDHARQFAADNGMIFIDAPENPDEIDNG